MSQPGPEVTRFPSNRVHRLHNVVCPYCGAALTNANREKEHVIARNFVPRGKLHAQWNLILNACGACNKRKSGYEDDISAISMQPDAYGRFGSDDPDLVAESQRTAITTRKRAASRRRRPRPLTAPPVQDGAPWRVGPPPAPPAWATSRPIRELGTRARRIRKA